MKLKPLTRRKFLYGLGGAVGLASWLSRAIALEQGLLTPRRFIVYHRPVGTVQAHWWPDGAGTDLSSYQMSRILTPFMPHLSDMVVLRGLGLPYDGSSGGGGECGLVLSMTGRRCPNLYEGNGGDDPMAEGPSVEQLLVRSSPVLQDAPVQSVAVSCDERADTPGEVSTRHLSYSGPHMPIRPYYQPLETYQRIFGTLLPDGEKSGLQQALAARRSVLDFALRDLQRMRGVAPAAQWDKLDAYEDAVRQVESELVETLAPASCGIAEPPSLIPVNTRLTSYSSDMASPERDDLVLSQIGELHTAVIRAAFKCDLNRVATFQWAPATNHVSFGGLWPPNPTLNMVHHPISHRPGTEDVREFLTRVEEWFAQRLAMFIQSLKDTTDITGKPLFATTVLAYITEVGQANSAWDNMPWLLLGGGDTGIRGGQVWTHDGSRPSSATSRNMRSTNDFWMSLGRPFGVDDFVLGDDRTMYSGPIEGLFSP